MDFLVYFVLLPRLIGHIYTNMVPEMIFFYICKLLVLLNVNYYIKGYIYYFITNSILDKNCHN